MKKLTTNVGVFGPFSSAETLEDRYHCDGADFHFTVVGQGVISDVEEGDFPPPEVVPVIPVSVSMKSARKALILAGIPMATINAAFDAIPDATQKELAKIDWEFSSVVLRDSPLVASMAGALGLSSAEVDGLFVAASQIPD